MKKFLLLFLFNILHSFTYAQPDELFRGRHTISGGTYGHPYTTIDRRNGDDSLMQTIHKIRKRVFDEYLEEKYIEDEDIVEYIK